MAMSMSIQTAGTFPTETYSFALRIVVYHAGNISHPGSGVPHYSVEVPPARASAFDRDRIGVPLKISLSSMNPEPRSVRRSFLCNVQDRG